MIQNARLIFTPRQWLILAASFVVLSLASGLMFTFGIFLKPLESAFEGSRSALSFGYSIFMIVGFVSAVPMGKFADRCGARTVVLTGAILNIFALGMASVMQTVWQFYLLIGVMMGMGRSAFSIATVAYVQRAFTQNRGLATGLAGSGSGLGISMLIPLAGYSIATQGWRSTYAYLAVVVLVSALPAAFYLRPVRREETDETHAASNGKHGHHRETATLPEASKSITEIMKRRPFWTVLGSHTCDCICHSVVIVHLVPFARESGIPEVIAASLIGTMGAGAVAGRIMGGILADRIGGKWALFISLLSQTAPVPLLLLAPSLTMLYFIAVFVGLGMGGHGTMYPFVTREFYGPKRVGVLFGTFTMGGSLGMATGGFMGGLLYDLSGDYTLSFLFSFTAGLFSLLMVWLYPNRVLLPLRAAPAAGREVAQSAG